MNETSSYRIPVLTFRLGEQDYGLRIEHVVEVAAMVAYSPVADTNPALLGLVNRHGTVLPLLDLRKVFEVPATAIDTNVLFIVATYQDALVGVVVDMVNQVEYIVAKSLRVAPGGGRWVDRVASHGDHLLQIIAIDALMKHYLPDSFIDVSNIEDSD